MWSPAGVQGQSYLVTEYCAGGDLWSALNEEPTQYTWYNRYAMAHVASSLAVVVRSPMQRPVHLCMGRARMRMRSLRHR